MKTRLQRAAAAAALAAGAALLGACGGGGGASEEAPGPTPSAGSIPRSAVASATAWAAYAATLADSDTGTPLDVNGVTPPTTETGSPNAL